jgi:hypothetical protein
MLYGWVVSTLLAADQNISALSSFVDDIAFSHFMLSGIHDSTHRNHFDATSYCL